ncbi:MAG: polymerase subunit delta [Pseudomonadota bacterium]
MSDLAPWLARQRDALLTQRGHAWLLHGPAGLGQYELALSLAQAWLCEAPGEQRPACGQCPSCHAIEVRTHADLAVLMPETQMQAQGWPLSEKAQAELDEKKRKPGKEIRVETLREVVEFCQRTDARGRGKVVLVYPAERLNAISANALLKTLEEPAGDVRFVLATEAAQFLLPTIRSRCQAHTMAWPGQDEALAWLQTQGLSGPAAQALWQHAGGRPQQALVLQAQGQGPDWWAQLPEAMRQGRVQHLADLSPAQVLDALQKLCHDLGLVAVGAPPRFFAREQLPPRPLPLAPLTSWFKQLRQTARHVEHPFNTGLMLEALTAQARQAMNAKADAALF